MTKEERKEAKQKEKEEIRKQISALRKEMKQAYATKDDNKANDIMNQINELRTKLWKK